MIRAWAGVTPSMNSSSRYSRKSPTLTGYAAAIVDRGFLGSRVGNLLV